MITIKRGTKADVNGLGVVRHEHNAKLLGGLRDYRRKVSNQAKGKNATIWIVGNSFYSIYE